MAKHVKSKSKA